MSSASAAPQQPEQICDGCLKIGAAGGSSAPIVAAGHEEEVAGIDCYITGSGVGGPGSDNHAIILCTDIFGWRFPPVRALADFYVRTLSTEGRSFTVYIPSFLNDPVRIEDRANFRSQFAEWVARNPPAHMAELATKVIEAARLKQFRSIQIVGYCMGAKPAVEILKQGLVDAGVLFHPTLLAESDAPLLRDAGIPLLFCCAETDGAFTPEIRESFRKVLLDPSAPAASESDVKIYPNTAHGFGVRPEESEIEQSKLANADACAFFKRNAIKTTAAAAKA